MLKQAAIQPEVFLCQEAEVAVVDVESKVVTVTVECNDFALGIGRHPLEEDTFVVFHIFGPFFLRLTGKLHLMELNNIQCKSNFATVNNA